MFKLSFKQQVLTGFTVSLLFVVISALVSYLSINSLRENTNWQAHTYEVIDLSKKIELHILHTETGMRGYVITQNRDYLDPYHEHLDQILPAIADLKKLVNDNPKQVDNVDSMEFYARQKIQDMQAILQINDSKGQNEAVAKVLSNTGKISKDNIIRINKQIEAMELGLLKERKLATQISSERTTLIILISSLVIFGLILFLLSYIRKTFDQQKETEVQIRENNTQLELLSTENKQKNWLLSGVGLVNEAMRGEQEIDELATNLISSICNYLNTPIGAIFLIDKKKNFQLTGTYAYVAKGAKKSYAFGEGFIGQTALEKKSKLISEVPTDYLKIDSALGSTSPNFIHFSPILFQNETIGVIELGLTSKPDHNLNLFLDSIAENVGIAINSAFSRVILRDLFEQTQQQAEELEAQQEELRTTNEELQVSEEELRVQQEELRQTNIELEEKAVLLEEKNASINQAREAMSLKATELEMSSKYKSEFLANMSHELRTPLNSILILAKILKENKPDNLNDDQVKYAGVIHNAGTDLLNLINDILDLSKIEAGKIDLTVENVRPKEIKSNMESLFNEVATTKKVNFHVNLDSNLPSSFTSDQSRLEQIVKNLLSNAFKFTSANGSVTLTISKADEHTHFYAEQLKTNKTSVIAIDVKDTGIGISADKQKVIFEAFQQEDGSTSRKYGGTGLGLSISKQLAQILGGEIQLKSEIGTGSSFTLYIPQNLSTTQTNEGSSSVAEPATKDVVESITFTQPIKLETDNRTILIIEDDLNFADILKDYALEKGFKPLLAHSGDSGLEMAISQLPDAIILDIMLPVMDGWTVLKKLKANPITKHIPVHIMSARDEKLSKAKQEGAIGFLKKPINEEGLAAAFDSFSHIQISHQFNKILLIEDQELHSQLLTQQLLERGAEVTQVYSGEEALNALKDQQFNCIILDLNLPDISGFDLLDDIKANPDLLHIPVIINTAMELGNEQMERIMRHSEAMILKTGKSNDRLMDEVSLFMNKLNTESKKPDSKPKANLSTIEKTLKDKTILVADDDMRNIFALSTALQAYDMKIVIANNGREAIERLEENSGIDLVLMDIMMPEMDGYEAMTAIRKKKQFAKLPIIALTAKAMKNDREKCIEAGANDYISKPVDVDRLLSMMRVWLSN
ncbi:response regulator [Pedobacter sp. LMG 31464]|uniref:histidine kinase n=1 Tax=Pedobacter planticolens TaxID=2679964 RepID=A0A923E1G4_9SPHI|nr:response regulator [Pedobacter planticolens]MBB2146950.1 response regulator [Pedobacter planticolens]